MALTVGQLAKRTGLTVRALHHYHAIGLLAPSHRSASGYRLYTHADVVRLYQIQALRRLGLSLPEIGAVLKERGASLPEIVGRQIDELDDRIEHAEALKTRLVHLRDVLAQGGEPVVGDWLAAVELITLYDRYCSPEELHRLLAYRRTGIEDWRALIADVRTALTQGVAPESQDAQTLGHRWRDMVLGQVGGDTNLAIKMKLAYADQPDLQARMQAQSGLGPDLVEYLWQIWRHGQIALWTRCIGADAAVRLQFSDDRLRDWLRVVAEMRDAMKSGREPDSDGVQLGLRQWDAFVDELVAGDATLTRQVVEAFETDLELQQAWAVDAALLTFVNQARRSALRRGASHA
jgi:DNA-binding transcriptional MerR regulator